MGTKAVISPSTRHLGEFCPQDDLWTDEAQHDHLHYMLQGATGHRATERRGFYNRMPIVGIDDLLTPENMNNVVNPWIGPWRW